MADRSLNATQGSLLGFLHDGPQTGWDLLRLAESRLSRFWNVTTSHVYRELGRLEERKLIRAGPPGPRDRRPFSLTPAGRRAFREWIAEPPGAEQMRVPLLVTLLFGRHLDAAQLDGFLEQRRADHAQRLELYAGLEDEVDDPYLGAVLAYGMAYEQAVLDWLAQTRRKLPGGP